jgi:integrase
MTTKRKSRRIGPPPYCHHKSSGQAYVNLDGKEHYLGKHNTPASLQAYAVLLAEYSSGAVIDETGKAATTETGLTIAELALAYVKHAQNYYMKNGQRTDEVSCIKSALCDLMKLYGDLPAGEFGPIALKAVRHKMTEERDRKIGKKVFKVKWTRRYINKCVGRIRRMFKWAIENELVEPTVLLKLQAVAPLMKGRTDAKEHTPRHPIDLEVIEKVKALVPTRTKDLIELWLLTGARPGELIKLTGEMIDRSQDVWLAKLADHKTVHRGKQRVLVFGPKAQLILTQYLSAEPTRRLFPINRATASDAIKNACRKLKIPIFTAHWLRHTAGTRIREEYGLDASQVTLGHANADITELYAGLDLNKAINVAREVG